MHVCAPSSICIFAHATNKSNRPFTQINLYLIICSFGHRNFKVGHRHGAHDRVGTLKWGTNMAAMASRENAQLNFYEASRPSTILIMFLPMLTPS